MLLSDTPLMGDTLAVGDPRSSFIKLDWMPIGGRRFSAQQSPLKSRGVDDLLQSFRDIRSFLPVVFGAENDGILGLSSNLFHLDVGYLHDYGGAATTESELRTIHRWIVLYPK